MRTYDAIKSDVDHAISINHAVDLRRLADELRALDSHEARALMYSALGQSCALCGEHHEALIQFEQALRAYEECSDAIAVARVTGNIGNVRKSIGDYAAALEHYHRALGMFEELGDRSGMAAASTGIGMVHWFHGDYPVTLDYFYRSLAQHEAIGDIANVAIVTGNIGIVLSATGNFTLALEQFRRSLALHEGRGARHSVAHAHGNIGSVYVKMNEFDEALSHFGRSLDLHREHGNLRGIALATGHLVSVYVALESLDEAKEHLAALDDMSIDDPNTRIEREMNRAALQTLEHANDAANATLLSALAIAAEHGLRAREAELHEALRNVAQHRNEFPAYIEHNNAYVRITEEINGKETATKLAIQSTQREIEAERKEHEKQMAVLHSTLPKHVAERVARGEMVNDTYDNAAVLFLDVVGFTTHTSSLEVGVVVELLQRIFTTFDAICAEQSVMKIKTIGDSYMAVAFPSDDHVNKIAAVACAMQQQIFTWPSSGEPVLFRVGLHVGPIVAGVLGTERLQYDVWGDTVNVASRMESTGAPGRVHASAAYAACLNGTSNRSDQPPVLGDHEYRTVERGEIEIKGKGVMKTFWIEW